MAPGDIAVASDLTLPARPELEGSRTRRVTTLRHGTETSRREQIVTDPAPAPSSAAAGSGPLAAEPGGTVYATLAYEDRKGPRRVPITSNQVVIGRGGVGYWVDVKLDVSADVSREHLRLRRDEATGQFFLKDLSSLGTTIDGTPAPSSVEVVEGRKRDVGVEVPLPPRARIALANVIVIDFESGSAS
ncbi:MAG: FHA domain-containing protein [Acidobacteria bacterium]|nr:MAG: FHA domain-containing protein [Acidobacteriota bacterium]